MDIDSLLAHTEADGTLRQAGPRGPAPPALGSLGGRIDRRPGRRRDRPGRGPARRRRRGPRPRRAGPRRSAQPRYATDAAAAEALCRAAGATIVARARPPRAGRALARRGPAPRRPRRHPRHRGSRPRTARRPSPAGTTASAWRRCSPAPQRPWVHAARPGLLRRPGSGAGGHAPAVEPWPSTLPADAHHGDRHRGAPTADEQTIRPDAKLLFVAGAGWTKKQADGQSHADEAGDADPRLPARRAGLARQHQVAGRPERRGRRRCCTFLTHLNQVGQTGSTPRHPKGLATCCHGEEPHVVGWRFISERRAINLDPNCGWAHGKADVLYVADAFEVMRKVNELLAA